MKVQLRAGFSPLKNRHDTEDVFQNVYMKYLLYEGFFENDEHEKAWFVRVTLNACTDWQRAFLWCLEAQRTKKSSSGRN